jgi:hypothetical protein
MRIPVSAVAKRFLPRKRTRILSTVIINSFNANEITVAILLNPNIEETTTQTRINPIRTALIPAALSQQIYFEAMMYMVSTHLDVLRRTESSRTTLIHRGKSLKLINDCVKQQKASPSDLLIATVFGLANYDVSLPISFVYNNRSLILMLIEPDLSRM